MLPTFPTKMHAGMSTMGHKDLDRTPKIGMLSKHIALSTSPVACRWSNESNNVRDGIQVRYYDSDDGVDEWEEFIYTSFYHSSHLNQ
jgi:hypothetical protein